MTSMLGCDFAAEDENTEPDFKAMYEAGGRFVIIRRSSCYYDHANQAWRMYHDPCYERDAQRARDAGLVVGSYLFPAFGQGSPSPAAQVANFAAAGGDIKRGIDLPPMFDLEFPGNGIKDTGISQADALTKTAGFLTALRSTYGCWSLLYTSHVEVHDDNGLGLPTTEPATPSVEWNTLHNCPLMIKIPYRLKADEPVDQVAPAEPVLPAPWHGRGWWIRQSQGDAIHFPGFDKTVDVDDFHVLSSANAVGDPRVAYVQRAVGADADGVWGPGTETALRAFQTAKGLTADAMVGVQTFVRLAWSA